MGCADAQEVCQLTPFLVFATAPDRKCKRLQPLQSFDFRSQLGDAACRCGLVKNLLLGSLDLVLGRLLQIFIQAATKSRVAEKALQRQGL